MKIGDVCVWEICVYMPHDTSSQVVLICQSYFEWEILPHIRTLIGEKAEAHQLFQLTAANNEKPPMSMYVKLVLCSPVLDFGTFTVPCCFICLVLECLGVWLHVFGLASTELTQFSTHSLGSLVFAC